MSMHCQLSQLTAMLHQLGFSRRLHLQETAIPRAAQEVPQQGTVMPVQPQEGLLSPGYTGPAQIPLEKRPYS